RVGNGVVAVAGGQRRQAGAVEVDAVGVQEIRVLVGLHAAGREPDLPLLLVHLGDAAHHPQTPSDLVLDLAGGDVDQVQVVPSVALGGPQDLLALGGEA